MVFKSYSGTTTSCEPIRKAYERQDGFFIPPRQKGNLIALVGTPNKGQPSNRRKEEHLETLAKIDDEILGYNLDGRICLMRTKKNDRNFDTYLTLPFTKGVTERISGRTMLILGSSSHHGEAMVGQFEGVLWNTTQINEAKKYGDTIRWVNVGNTKTGFIGLDFNNQARKEDGVAISIDDVKFLAKSLLEFGYEEEKRLYLLKPPYIVESIFGKALRKQGYETLKDYAK